MREAYPGFESYVIERLSGFAGTAVHFAIGDVDDLTGYVTTIRTEDPTMFGHLAGNACMRSVGEATRAWVAGTPQRWPFVLVGTFGGDEIIAVAAGVDIDEFGAAIAVLADAIRSHAPRPCSIAFGTAEILAGHEPVQVYRHVVSCIDAALFSLKTVKRAQAEECDGDVISIGSIPDIPPGRAHEMGEETWSPSH